ncbi:MAG: hypothetical protein QME42_08050 [bacterium]|nr:hypothetical protein [bacterium]
MEQSNSTWTHPGGKLIELGAETLTEDELLTILIGTGCKGMTAQKIARNFFDKFFGFYGLFGKKPADFLGFQGLKDKKIKRIMAVYEIMKRIIKENGWNFRAIRKITLELPELSDAELLAILIGSGYKDDSPVDIANKLLKKYKSLSGITGENLSELWKTSGYVRRLFGDDYSSEGFLTREKMYEMAKIKGLGDVKVARIAAAYEVMRRMVMILEKE